MEHRQVGKVGEHKGAAIGFHQTPVSSRLPQAFVSLANKECHCVLPDPQMKIVKLAPLPDLKSNRRKLLWVWCGASNFMDDFSQPDWAVMGFQLERSPERRSKVKIEFFGQSDRSITSPAA